MSYTTTPAQRRANRKYKRTHRRKNRITSDRGACKRFIMEEATSIELHNKVAVWLKVAEKRRGSNK